MSMLITTKPDALTMDRESLGAWQESACAEIMTMRVALRAIMLAAPSDPIANDPNWVRRVAREALGEET